MKEICTKTKSEPFPDFDRSLFCLGSNKQNGKELFHLETAESTISAGFWEADANVTQWLTYPCTEFMLLLEGECAIIETNKTSTFRAGDSFCIAQGAKVIWAQTGRLRKVYVAVTTKAPQPSKAPSVQLIDPGDQAVSFAIFHTNRLWDVDSMEVGVRKVKKGQKIEQNDDFHLIHVVDGDEDGKTFFLEKGAQGQFGGNFVAIYCTVKASKKAKL